MTDEQKELVLNNLDLVNFILHRHFKPSRNDWDDYYQEGCYGLCLAAVRYNPDKFNTAFSTLAYPYIVGCIKRYKRDTMLIKYSRKALNVYGQVVKMLNEGYSDEEIIIQLSISRSILSEVMAITSVTSLEKEISEDESKPITIGDTIGYEESFDSDLIEEDILKAVDTILVKASEKARNIYEEVIYSRLFEDNPTQSYLAKKYNCSQAQVSRIINKYDKELKEYMKWQKT